MDSHHWRLENLWQVLSEWRRFFAGSIVLILVVNLHHSSSTARHVQVSTKVACRDIGTKNHTFLAFLPCLERIDNLNDTRSILEECDLLTRAAVGLAVDRLNQELTNYTLNVASLSHVPNSNHQSINVHLEDVINTFRALHLSDLFGVIGPYSSDEVKFWAPIFQYYNLSTVSYDITSIGADQESSFYRTLPSDHEANIGRLSLMVKFEWFRIAIISSNETYYAQAGKDLTNMYHDIVRRFDPDGELALLTTFSDSPEDAISEIKLKDFNVIFGFFGARNARKVLCKANSEGLISHGNAWILPSYYNSNWWKIQDEESLKDDGCSNEKMRNILESVIFIDTVKFPPTDLTLMDFHSQLVSKALDLFPSLIEEDLKPYLLRSRATSAYDAVTLLAQSVGMAFKENEGNCINTNLVQVALERMVMYCEYCRLNSGCFLDASETKQCQDVCGSDSLSIPDPKLILQSQSNLLYKNYLHNEFGQIFYSQFIGGEECPVALLWHSGHGLNMNGIVTIDVLHQLPCASRLNVSKQNFAREGSNCPQTFQWKGSTGPPRTSHLSAFKISIAEITIISILTGLAFLSVVMFLVINIVWRNNKAIKATSPWLNVVFLVGVVIRLPTAMLESLTLSTAGYGFNDGAMRLVCNLAYWTRYIGEAVFLSALIVKNWRIYRLFHNKTLKRFGKTYSDFRLVIGVLFLQLLIVVMLIVKAALFHARLEVRNLLQPENLLYVSFSFCISDHEIVFVAVLMTYNSVLLFVVFLLAFLNTLVHLSMFRREGLQSLQVAIIIFIPIVMVTVIQHVLTISFQIVYLKVILWMEFTLGVLLPTLTSAILFMPNVWYLVKTKELPTKNVPVPSLRNPQSTVLRISHYHQLLKDRETLKKQLSEINEQISKLSVAETQRQHEEPEGEVEDQSSPPLDHEVLCGTLSASTLIQDC